MVAKHSLRSDRWPQSGLPEVGASNAVEGWERMSALKRLLLERGARPQPHTLAANHDVAEARRLLEDNPSEHVVEELLWSAADHGCPKIVAMALTHIQWPLNDQTSHWVLMQPVRGAGDDPARNQGHFASLDLILRAGVDPNVARMGAATLHFTAARGGLDGASRARFAWAHHYSLPKLLSADAKGRLHQTPFERIKHWSEPVSSLSEIDLPDGAMKPIEKSSGSSLNVRAVFKRGESRSLTLRVRSSPDEQEYTDIQYHWEIGRLILDRSHSSLGPMVK